MYCEIEHDKPCSTGAALTRCIESITVTMAPNDRDDNILKQNIHKTSENRQFFIILAALKLFQALLT